MSKAANWNDIPKKQIIDKAFRRVYSGDKVMAVQNTIEPGAPMMPHHHEHDQLLYIESGRCEVLVGEETIKMGPGDIVHIPSNVEHGLLVLGDEKVVNIDMFAPIREDFLE